MHIYVKTYKKHTHNSPVSIENIYFLNAFLLFFFTFGKMSYESNFFRSSAEMRKKSDYWNIRIIRLYTYNFPRPSSIKIYKDLRSQQFQLEFFNLDIMAQKTDNSQESRIR